METVDYSKMHKSPFDRANPISKMIFFWTVDFFKISYSKAVEFADLFAPNKADQSDHIGSKLERYYNAEVKRCERIILEKNITEPKKMPKPSLGKALLATFKWEFFLTGILAILNEGFVKLTQPMLLGRLLSYFKQEPLISEQEALLCAGGIVLLNVVTTFCFNHYVMLSFQMGMRARVAVCSLIYRKSLRLSRTALGDSAPGKVVNLLSNDVNRFDYASMFLHYLWIAPATAILVMLFLFNEVGLAGILGVCVVFTVMPLQGYTGKLSAKYRLQTAYKTDERVRLMDEIISGVQVIKMYTWEKPFSKLITLARRLELNIVKKNSYVRAVYMSFLLFTTRAAIYCTMTCMVLFGEPLTASKVFVFAQYFGTLSNTMSAMFVRAITETAEAGVSMRRLEKYLNQDEYQASIKCSADVNGTAKNQDAEGGVYNEVKQPPAIKISKATAKWLHDSHDYHLKDVNVEIPKGKLVGIIGPVGSGKSTLLQAILGEINLESGCVEVNGKVSYASQEAWVFGSSVRQNILFGLPFYKSKYDEVVRVCSLQKDFQQFPHGDQTLVGDKGASLSGGQKARINLARAVYRETSIYLLDDPLSAVDSAVGKWLYERCINGYLRSRTRLLVTHQLHHLRNADYIIVMNNGRIEMQGTYDDISRSNLEFASLLMPSGDKAEDSFPEADCQYKDRWSRKKHDYSRKNSISSLASMRSMSISSSFVELAELSLDELDESEHQPQQQVVEASSKGAVKGSMVMLYAKAGAGKLAMVTILFLFLAAQTFASLFDYYVSFWSGQEELRSYSFDNEKNTHLYRGNETFSIYDGDTNFFSEEFLMLVGGVFVSLIMIVGLTRAIYFYKSCMRASQRLHDTMFRGIIRSPMKFFDDNPSGRIMNRFSKDMGAVDEMLPKATMDASQMILTMCGSVVLTAFVNPLFLVVMFVIGVFFFFARRIYLKSSKNIKRMEGIARSPVFTHLSATLQGLTTVRACGAQEAIKREFDKLQDVHTSAFYMFLATSASFGFCLDVLCLFFVCIVIFSFFIIDTGVFSEKVGLAITQAMSLTFLMQYGIRQSAEVANQLMAVERMQEYTHLTPEKNLEPDDSEKKRAMRNKEKLPNFVTPPKGWPEKGKVEFRNMSLKYGTLDTDPYVLKQLNCVIKGGEKVGIVGRTGAGKSSLIQAMFRLANVEGDILIDDINTAEISLETLRGSLSIIPQDPILFSGTLRRNLDPFEEYSDNRLWDVLTQVELKESLNDPAGLNMNVMDGGANFSVGQRQLICLARALLRNNRILMMDEATANVDPYTDNLIQQTIRTKFADCTVLTIAHRLNTIMDSDKVLVMDFGKIVEFDHPYTLLQKKGETLEESGSFYKMLMETGQDNSRKLEKISENCFKKM